MMHLLQHLGGDDSCQQAIHISVLRPAYQSQSAYFLALPTAVPIAVPMHVQHPSAFQGYNGCQPQCGFEPSIHTKFCTHPQCLSQSFPASAPSPNCWPAVPSIRSQPFGLHRAVSQCCTCAAALLRCKDSC